MKERRNKEERNRDLQTKTSQRIKKNRENINEIKGIIT